MLEAAQQESLDYRRDRGEEGTRTSRCPAGGGRLQPSLPRLLHEGAPAFGGCMSLCVLSGHHLLIGQFHTDLSVSHTAKYHLARYRRYKHLVPQPLPWLDGRLVFEIVVDLHMDDHVINLILQSVR